MFPFRETNWLFPLDFDITCNGGNLWQTGNCLVCEAQPSTTDCIMSVPGRHRNAEMKMEQGVCLLCTCGEEFQGFVCNNRGECVQGKTEKTVQINIKLLGLLSS